MKNHIKTEISIENAIQCLHQYGGLIAFHKASSFSPLSGSRIQTDSRAVCAGDIFLAYTGTEVDGFDFIGQAVDKHAALVVTDKPIEHLDSLKGSSYALVSNAREAWTFLCASANDNPEQFMHFIGVTGTNGKTSTLWMLRSLLTQKKVATLSIGTLGIFEDTSHVPSNHTTPDPPVLFFRMAEALKKGIKTVLMEVSSHSSVQKKLGPIKFSAMGWTSFSRDHLDFHNSMGEYWQAKLSVFERHMADSACMAIAASVSPFPKKLENDCRDFYVYEQIDGDQQHAEIRENHDLKAEIRKINTTLNGTSVQVKLDSQTLEGTIPYWGQHNVENFLCAVILARSLDGLLPKPCDLAKLQAIPGRLQIVHRTQPSARPGQSPELPLVLVDFAHTPDALKNSLLAVREFCKGQLILVFGCGGDRDKGKRPQMGKVAETHADLIILTSDNPRHEDSKAIVEDICRGFSDRQTYMVELDRKKAICQSISSAKPLDIVLLAGKGHETYQIIGNQRLPFNDYAIASDELTKMHEGL